MESNLERSLLVAHQERKHHAAPIDRRGLPSPVRREGELTMDKLLSFIVPVGLHILYCLAGAFFTEEAICYFTQKKYFCFGINLMLAILQVLFLIRTVFTW